MYQAIYRQFRPRTFDDVLGQDHIINTLKNQIANNNIGHAYLFSGTRGTGKTSTAKILSRGVNCLDPKGSNPCNQCQVCQGLLDGSIMDVVEMDAASNRGVNDIRELKDKVFYPPSYAKYKVYIIDEVHMLTQEAFNALLKTLEEPPQHLIFILATTEPERIPETILSRCQRFDFKRISSRTIIENMEAICRELGVEVEPRALEVIARNSDGGMRDALSLLDQALSFSQGDLKYQDAVAILGIVNMELFFQLGDQILDKSIDGILLSIDRLMEEGRDVNQFIKDIIKHFRDLMIVKTSDAPRDLLQVNEETLEAYKNQAQDFSLDYILRILDILSQVDEKSKLSTEPRILLEMAMIRIVAGENLSLEERLSRLEEGGPLASRPASSQARPGVKAQPEPASQAPKKDPSPGLAREEKEAPREAEPLQAQDNLGDLSLGDMKNAWDRVLDFMRQDRVSTHAIVKEAELVGLENNTLSLGYDDKFVFHMEMMESQNYKDYVSSVISQVLGRDLEIRIVKKSEKKTEVIVDENKEEKLYTMFGKNRVKIEE